MARGLRVRSIALTIAVAGALSAGAALAGGSMGDDDHDDSRNLIGVVRDFGSGPMPDARIAATTKTGSSIFVTRTDQNGRYRITGFPADIDPNSLVVTCTRDGFRHVRSVMRNPNPPPEAPVEIDCLMERQ